MQKIPFVLALAGSVFAGNAFAREPVCNYAAGETLLHGPHTSDVRIDCELQSWPDSCRLHITTQLFACANASGQVTRSGILTVTRHGPARPDPRDRFD